MADELSLTPAEKLIASLLCSVMKRLGVTDEDEFDPDFIMSAINSGETWAIGDKYDLTLFMPEKPSELRHEVGEILSAWDYFLHSYDRLSIADKQRVAQELGREGRPTFLGFDGNLETTYYSHATFLIKDQQLFGALQDSYLNSHSPSLGEHRRKVALFKTMSRPGFGEPFTAEQIVQFLKA